MPRTTGFAVYPRYTTTHTAETGMGRVHFVRVNGMVIRMDMRAETMERIVSIEPAGMPVPAHILVRCVTDPGLILRDLMPGEMFQISERHFSNRLRSYFNLEPIPEVEPVRPVRATNYTYDYDPFDTRDRQETARERNIQDRLRQEREEVRRREYELACRGVDYTRIWVDETQATSTQIELKKFAEKLASMAKDAPTGDRAASRPSGFKKFVKAQGI